MKRRGFLQACLATACAPAIIRIEALMQPRAIAVATWDDLRTYTKLVQIDVGAFDSGAQWVYGSGIDYDRALAEAIRNTRDEISENIMANNALLRRLQARGHVREFRGGIAIA